MSYIRQNIHLVGYYSRENKNKFLFSFFEFIVDKGVAKVVEV